MKTNLPTIYRNTLQRKGDSKNYYALGILPLSFEKQYFDLKCEDSKDSVTGKDWYVRLYTTEKAYREKLSIYQVELGNPETVGFLDENYNPISYKTYSFRYYITLLLGIILGFVIAFIIAMSIPSAKAEYVAPIKTTLTQHLYKFFWRSDNTRLDIKVGYDLTCPEKAELEAKLKMQLSAISQVQCDIPKPYCGDHIRQEIEMCDDGNNIDGDGCSADCKKEELERTGASIVECPKNHFYNEKKKKCEKFGPEWK